MALTDAEIQLIQEGITLAISSVLAVVQASAKKGAIDWNSVKIADTPEAALTKAKAAAAPPASS